MYWKGTAMLDALLELYDAPFSAGSDKVLTGYFLHAQMDGLRLATAISETGLSKSTIVRYCQRMGAAQYTDFRARFLQERQTYRGNYRPVTEMKALAQACVKGWHPHLLVFGEEEALRVWRQYRRDFFQKGCLLSTWSRDVVDPTCVYTATRHDLWQFANLNIRDHELNRFCTRQLRDPNCVLIAPVTGREAGERVIPSRAADPWDGKIQLMQAIETILGCME